MADAKKEAQRYNVNKEALAAASPELQATWHNVVAIETLQRMIQDVNVPVKSLEIMLRILDFLQGQWMDLTGQLEKAGILSTAPGIPVERTETAVSGPKA